MAELIARSPCAGLLPLEKGGVTVTELDPGPMTLVAPLKRQAAALSKAMQAAHGVGFPAPNTTETATGTEAAWFGRDQALLIGAVPDPTLARHAALSDQGDAWAVVRVAGEGVAEVLARLIPVDLRDSAFPPGRSIRTQIGHMAGAVTRLPDGGYRLMVFRSMAGTLVHDLERVLTHHAARGTG